MPSSRPSDNRVLAEAPTGAVVWITGLSGAGKSSVAVELVHRLRDQRVSVVLLDGDEVRGAVEMSASFDAESRRRLARTYARLCRLIAAQGHVVVCATVSLYREVHDWNRHHLPRYVEVLLDVPVSELSRRNSKGLYGSDAHNVVGIDLHAEFPANADLVIPNHGSTNPQEAAAQIFEHCARIGTW